MTYTVNLIRAFCKVNVEAVPELMNAFQLRSIPTVLLLKPNAEGGGARVVDAMIGAKSLQNYHQWINRYLNPPPSLWRRLTAWMG